MHSLKALGPKSPKKGLPAPPGPECSKKCLKGPTEPEKESKRNHQGRALYGPIPVKTETNRELSGSLVHTNFGGNPYGPIIGPYHFLGKFVWTNGPESSSKVSPYTGIGPWMALKGIMISACGLFRHFFDTPGSEAREDLFETFWGFRGSGMWRLLYMGIAIVILYYVSKISSPATRI